MRTNQFLVPASVVTTLVFVYIALIQPVMGFDQLETETFAELRPGEKTTEIISFSSDRTFPTEIHFIIPEDSKRFLSVKNQSLQLPPDGVVHNILTIKVPHNFTDTGTIQRSIVIEEKTFFEDHIEYLDEQLKVVTIEVLPTNNISTITPTNKTTSQNETTATTNQTENKTSTDTTKVVNETVVETPEDAPVEDVADEPTETIEEPTVTRETTTEEPAVTEEPATDDTQTFEEVQDLELRKIAYRIEEQEERANSTSESYFDHQFYLTRNDLNGISLQLSEAAQDLEVSVSTLSLSTVEVAEDGSQTVVGTDTDVSGVTITPVTVLPIDHLPKEERDLFIEVGDARLPDIEKTSIQERVIGKTNKGEVVRRVTVKKAYRYLDIEVSGVNASSISRAGIDFEVSKTWLSRNGISPNEVTLNRLVNGEWVELETIESGESITHYRFSSDSPGFSFFSITAAITADITTPISIEVPQIGQEALEEGDVVGDILGTNRSDTIVSITVSWLFIVIILGAIIGVKFKDIRQALFRGDVKTERLRSLEKEKTRYERMKKETTRRFYKRAIPEDEFKSLVKEYDDKIIRLETEIAELRDGK